MIGTLDTSRREVTIVGAGIAGMLAAYVLDQKGYRVTLLEEKQRAGGLLNTRHTKYGIAEAAANSLLGSPAVLKLCSELGVNLVHVRKESRARYVLRAGKLRKFPLSLGEAASAVSHAAFSRATNHAEVLDLRTWGQRHLGDAGVEYLLTPFVRGIYGVQPAEVGVVAAFPKLVVPPGSTLLGMMLKRSFQRSASKKEGAVMVAPRHGMGDLIERLDNHLGQRLGNAFMKGVSVTEIPDSPNIVLATPAYKAAELFVKSFPRLSERLRAVTYTPLVSVTAFVARNSFTKPVKGVGVLIPTCEKRKCLGILFSSSSFEGRVRDETRWASFTIMMGGSADERWVSASDDEIKRTVQEELREILGVQDEPLEFVINRWPRAIPKYSVELPRLWSEARETWCATTGRLLFGNYAGQVSLRGMIESAAKLG